MEKAKFFILFLFYFCLGGILTIDAQERPNIILIMVDDLGYGDLGSYGQELIETPNLDFLAERGLRFTNYYSGSTVCAPSREALLTGMHTGHTFIRGNFLTDDKEDPAMPLSKVTIAEILKHAGYHTGIIGKWGLGGEGHGPETQGFDYSYGYLDQIEAHNYYPSFLFENGKKVFIKKNDDGVKGSYSHNLFFEKTKDFIRNSSEEKPFFLYLPYTIPHGKHVIPDNSHYSDKDWPEQFKNYAAMITLLDGDIGKMIDLLEEKGLDENTVVFFTSDNGANSSFAKFFKSNGSFRGNKTTLYEGGIRVPLIAYWPNKIKAGTVSEHVSATWDFLPTLCEIAAASVPDSIDGISFYPTLLGKDKQVEHSYLYWEYYTYNYNWEKPESNLPRNWLESRAVRMGKWKAIEKSSAIDKNGPIELYNLENDLSEKSDVSASNPAIVNKVKDIFKTSSTANAPFFPYRLQTINTQTADYLIDFFQYTPDRIPLVSAHRGGPRKGFPENCIATFENTLLYTPALLEIDPHYTKDGQIVLMHDPTLDRTTNGSGKVSDYTLAELKMLRLKDTEGNITGYRIPTLDEALQWAKGKTILVIDEKDVPIEVRVKKIMENKAEANAIVIAYSMEDIEKAYKLNENIMMEVMMGKMNNVHALDNSIVPWENIVGFVSHTLPLNVEVFKEIHKRGAMVIQGTSRNYDKEFMSGEINASTLEKGYLDIISKGADIIEADLGIEAGAALKQLKDENSSKAKYFK